MRNLFKLACVGAIALASLVACEKEITDNPNYNALTKTVNTDFVFNVSTGMTPPVQDDLRQHPGHHRRRLQAHPTTANMLQPPPPRRRTTPSATFSPQAPSIPMELPRAAE